MEAKLNRSGRSQAITSNTQIIEITINLGEQLTPVQYQRLIDHKLSPLFDSVLLRRRQVALRAGSPREGDHHQCLLLIN